MPRAVLMLHCTSRISCFALLRRVCRCLLCPCPNTGYRANMFTQRRMPRPPDASSRPTACIITTNSNCVPRTVCSALILRAMNGDSRRELTCIAPLHSHSSTPHQASSTG
jgi:hypothetical protein